MSGTIVKHGGGCDVFTCCRNTSACAIRGLDVELHSLFLPAVTRLKLTVRFLSLDYSFV